MRVICYTLAKALTTFPHPPKSSNSNSLGPQLLLYIVCNDLEERQALIEKLKANQVLAVFHYLSLHKSTFYQHRYYGETLSNSDHFSDSLLRLPLFYELTEENVAFITNIIIEFYKK